MLKNGLHFVEKYAFLILFELLLVALKGFLNWRMHFWFLFHSFSINLFIHFCFAYLLPMLHSQTMHHTLLNQYINIHNMFCDSRHGDLSPQHCLGSFLCMLRCPHPLSRIPINRSLIWIYSRFVCFFTRAILVTLLLNI